MYRTGWRIGLESALVLAVVISAVWLMRALPLIPAETAQPWSASTGEITIRGALHPATVGLNSVEVTLTDAAGQPVRSAQIEIAFLPVEGGAVIAQRALTEAGEGVYRASSFALTRLGPWQTLITLQRGADPIYATVDWRGDPDGVFRLASAPVPLTAPLIGWLNRSGAFALSGAALMVVAVWSWRVWRRLPTTRRFAFGWWLVPALLLAAGAGYVIALFTA
jgi:hypothetical protein